MKKFLLSLAIFSLVGVGSVQAQNCDPCCDSSGFYVGADFLYWTAYDADLDYAADNFDGYDVATENGGVSQMHFASYDWDPAFRVFLGYQSDCNEWDTRFSYLRFSSSKTSSASFGNGVDGHLKPTLWSPAFGNDRCQDASAKTAIKYHLFDLTVGKTCCLCNNFTFHPFAGFRAMVLNQNLDVVYSGGRDFSNFDGVVHWKSCFNAYGLTGGFDWKLALCGGMNAFGTIGVSVLGGSTDDLESQSGPEGVGGSSEIVNNINAHECQDIGLPGTQVSFGFNYEGCCETACGCTCYEFGLAYEMHHWYNVPNVRRYNGFPNEAANNAGGANGCLMLHGLVVRGAVSF